MGIIKILNQFKSTPLDDTGAASALWATGLRKFLSQADIDSDLISGEIKSDLFGVQVPISASLDDGYTGAAGAGWEPVLSNVNMGRAAFNTFSWFRFQANIPRNTIIESAVITFHAASSQSKADGILDIYVEEADDAVQMLRGNGVDGISDVDAHNDYMSRSKGAAINWQPGAWTGNELYDTPELKTILQPIFNRPGWNSGQYVQIFIYTVVGSIQSSHIVDSVEATGSDQSILNILYEK